MIANDHIAGAVAPQRVAELRRVDAIAHARSDKLARARGRGDHGTSRRGSALRTGDKGHRPGRRLCEDDLGRFVGRAAAGDPAAWAALVEEFDRMLRGIARVHRLCDADAADVAQATWLKLFEHLREIREPARVGGWLATTARRECVRVQHQSRRVALCPADPTPDRESPDAQPVDTVLARERQQAVRRGLSRLRARDQTLLALLSAGPRPDYHAIETTLQMPLGSIGPTRARALERLRAELESDGTLAWLAA